MNVALRPSDGFYTLDGCDLSAFEALTRQTVDVRDIPRAMGADHNVPIYDSNAIRADLDNAADRMGLMAEWANVLLNGAGVFVLRNAYADTTPIDDATTIFKRIIETEEAAGGGADHFAAAGNNARIWNSLQKLCEADPRVFVRYFANPVIDAACEAWLGPDYQMTAQVNLVRPGGKAQRAHRDYHLGFQSADAAGRFPAHVHRLSPLMTLQGGIAHCDMPVESGPTKLLPFSQAYAPGYAAYHREDFSAFFEEHYVQLPLQKGDAFFFNPALFHAAGENRSADIERLANLLQVSSAFGRAMETIDRTSMCKAIFAPLREAFSAGDLTEAELDATLAATAEGYPFPTNLDRDPPTAGLAPPSQKSILREAILEGWSADQLEQAMGVQAEKRAA